MSGLTPGRDEAVDLFAGTGWGVALRILGIAEHGVELMPEARATREANGMRNWLADVWDVLESTDPESAEFRAALAIMSPPCQTFSMAGNGAGRRALDEVLGLIDSRAYLNPAELRAFGERHDPRTALVLTPLTYVAQHAPPYVVMEQVPQVLPAWERMAVELRRWGYSVVTGILHSEQYGVPQTRRRAILIARADGVEARMPTPTHSRYYERSPSRLDEGVPRWVSMAEALGRGMTARPHFTITSGGAATGGYEPFPTNARKGIMREVEAGRWAEGGEPNEVTLVSAYSGSGRKVAPKSGSKRPRTVRHEAEPAVMITSKADRMTWVGNQKPNRASDDYQRRTDDYPAPTITGGSRSASWVHERPATTIQGDSRVWPPGHKVNADDLARDPDAAEKYGDRAGSDAIRVTREEAARLQTYPADFDWSPMVPVMRRGVPTGKMAPMTKTKAFLQIGNAVPPLLALRILETLTRKD